MPVRGTKRKAVVFTEPIKAAAAAVGATKAAKVAAPKKSRTTRQPKAIATPPAENKPPISLPDTPSLLPPTLKFSLADAISHLSRHDPRFKSLFDLIPCKPFHEPIEAIDPYKTLVTSIIGQQVSWMAARAITKRFKAHFGFDDEDSAFPTPTQVACAEVIKLREVGLSFRKAEYSELLTGVRQLALKPTVICLAQHFVEGKLSTKLLREGTDEEISKALIAVRGIGQVCSWTLKRYNLLNLS